MAEDFKVYSRNWLLETQGTATASTTAAGAIKNTIDESEFTSWQGLLASVPVITCYLGPTARTISHLLYYWTLTSVRVQYSLDGIAWFVSNTYATAATSGAITLTAPISAKYIKLDTMAGPATLTIWKLAAVESLFDIAAEYIVGEPGLKVPDFKDAGRRVQPMRDGRQFFTFENKFFGQTSLSLNLVPETTVLGWETILAANSKIVIVPKPTSLPRRWNNCAWEMSLPDFKKRGLYRAGTILFQDCV